MQINKMFQTLFKITYEYLNYTMCIFRTYNYISEINNWKNVLGKSIEIKFLFKLVNIYFPEFIRKNYIFESLKVKYKKLQH